MIFKSLNPTDISIRQFQVHKEFAFTNADSGSGIRAYEGLYLTTSFDPNSDPSHPNGVYKRGIYHTINTLYYRNSEDPYLNYGIQNTQHRQRILHNRVNVLSIPQVLFGEQIKSGSVELVDQSWDSTLIIKDDGYGNLYDSQYSIDIGSDATINQGLIGYWSFDTGYTKFNNDVTLVQDESPYNNDIFVNCFATISGSITGSFVSGSTSLDVLTIDISACSTSLDTITLEIS